jgi:glycolate oxidase iron-sulfur subunit
LIDRLINKQESLSADELEALDACTLCRACEKICPSKMAYGDLFLQAAEAVKVQDRPKRSWVVNLIFRLVSESRSRPGLLQKMLGLYQRSGLQRALRLIPLKGELRELNRLLPTPYIYEPIPTNSLAKSGDSLGKVGLFTGCIANVFDAKTHNATISLLTRMGYDVSVVENQTCCGATYAHNGDMEQAKSCARQNTDAFAESGLSTVIYNSSGCGAFLSEYPAILESDADEDRQEEIPITTDIFDFLFAEDRIGSLEFSQLKARVAVHESCSQRNVIGNSQLIYELLERVPGLEVVPLPGNEICCGAGGTKMVTQPELASPPRDEKVEALLETKADILLSTNLTCAMHMASGIREAGGEISVIHPVQLLARQMI